MKPTFLFIGPDKSGSTWIYEILKQHPQCFVPVVKDIYFFDRYYEKGTAWYEKFFEKAPKDSIAAGELSHDYLYSAQAAARIIKHYPDIRLMTSLRDPVERTFSHYLYLVRSGLTQAPFEDALEEFDELIENSLYYKYFLEYINIFPASQIKVLWFEQLQADPRAYAREIFDYLGISWTEDIDFEENVLRAGKPRVKALGWAAKQGANLFRDLGLPKVVGKIKHSRFTQALYKPYSGAEKPVIKPESAQKLKKIFREDILQLQDLLNKNLSHWID